MLGRMQGCRRKEGDGKREAKIDFWIGRWEDRRNMMEDGGGKRKLEKEGEWEQGGDRRTKKGGGRRGNKRGGKREEGDGI